MLAVRLSPLAALLFGASLSAQSYPWPDDSVVPVLFVPTDWSVSSSEVLDEADAIQSAVAEIHQYYGDQLGGRTFRVNELEVVQAWGPKEQYHIKWNGGNIYENGVEFTGNMEAAVVDELHQRGYPTPPAQNEDGYSTLIFVKGAGGYAGGREFGAGDGGWAILGDWCIDSLQNQVVEGQYWWSGRRKQTGAAAHELGHTFGLPHPDAYGGSFSSTIMGNWWDYPTIGFSAWDENFLWTNKDAFFSKLLLTLPALRAGSFAVVQATGAAPLQSAWLSYGASGLGLTGVPGAGVTLGVATPRLAAPPASADAAGNVSWSVTVPAGTSGIEVWAQALQLGEVSGIAAAIIQ